MHDTCVHGEPGQRSQLCSSLPSRSWNSKTWARSDLDTQSQGDPGCTHTQGAAHPQLQRPMPTRKVSERERHSICTFLGWRSQAMDSLAVRDSWLLGKMVCMESLMVTQCCSGSAQRGFLKGEVRHCWAETPCAHALGRGLRMQFAPTVFSWEERSEQCTARGFLSHSLTQLAGRRLSRAESSGLSTVRAWAWEQKGLELSI